MRILRSSLRQRHSGPVLCIAGGSAGAGQVYRGNRPRQGMNQPIHVYFGVPAERDLYLIEHFLALAERHPNLTFAPVLSEAKSAQYRSGFVAGRSGGSFRPRRLESLYSRLAADGGRGNGSSFCTRIAQGRHARRCVLYPGRAAAAVNGRLMLPPARGSLAAPSYK